MRPTVLLTDPDQRACLAAARALARSGHRVITIGRSRGLAGHSRAVDRHVSMDLQHETRDARQTVLAALIKQLQIDVVLPISDASSQQLLGAHDALGARVAGPSASAYARASDKDNVIRVAAQCGITVPAQRVLHRRDDGVDMLPALRYPLVAKPARSVSDVGGKIERHGVHFVDSELVMRDVLARLSEHSFPLLLQHRTVGDGIGVFLLRSNRTTLLSFGHRRIREKPPAGGVSTYRESIAPPAVLVERCEALLDALEYDGAAMIEFKQDATTGSYVLMEINARLWGSLQLAIDAGIDFPTKLVALACDVDVAAGVSGRAGVRTYWELGELDHAMAIARKSREELHVMSDVAVGTRAAVRALFDHRAEDHREVFRWSDPMPFAAELLRWIARR